MLGIEHVCVSSPHVGLRIRRNVTVTDVIVHKAGRELWSGHALLLFSRSFSFSADTNTNTDTALRTGKKGGSWLLTGEKTTS